MKRLSLLPALGLVGVLSAGCAYHIHEAKAEYHEQKAERAWEHGHPIKAAKEKIKENREERKAEHERF